MSRHDVHEFIAEVRDRPFAWGSWDCCQYPAEWVRRHTGKDLRAAFPAYATEAEAREILDGMGGLQKLVASALQEIHPAHAMVGDLVLANDERGGALGICLGVDSAHVGPNGLVFFRTLSAITAYRVE